MKVFRIQTFGYLGDKATVANCGTSQENSMSKTVNKNRRHFGRYANQSWWGVEPADSCLSCKQASPVFRLCSSLLKNQIGCKLIGNVGLL